ncbi:hypothetical protein DFH08DRAFT_812914 [Mycena albidolilacea]|uniref:Uncharacterized protein n=1 Tax=Mycena albidolilacea TaxID=1033008 RepID=A0AAD7ELP5_9AGAR|nr:hypothetical protein DFH08DRAFT_812914 [Mycena albidolilacea]
MSHLFLRIQVPGGATGLQYQRLNEFIELEKLDEFGNPEATKKSTKHKCPHKHQNLLPAENSDPDDLDYSADNNSSSDDDIQEIISNEELADSLPSKTLPESLRRPKDSALPKKKSKGKGKAPDPPPVPQPPKARRKTHNPIYYFFEEVNENADGSVEANMHYFKCYLGNRQVLKIGQKMNGSTHGLQTHLASHFVAHHRLYKVLLARGTAPTDVELAVAHGSTPITPEMAAEYLQSLDVISNNIKDMFEKQAAASQDPWNQEHFEHLLANWVATCDQPFSAVDDEEFHELLKYTHHPAKKLLKIPHAQAIRTRIDKMGEEMIAALAEIFKACHYSKLDYCLNNYLPVVGEHVRLCYLIGCLDIKQWLRIHGHCHSLHRKKREARFSAEESLIDFRELMGEHSDENMAAAVWDTLEKFLSLLEAIGALTKEEKHKAKSRAASYQDAATESLDRMQDSQAASTEDADDTEFIKPASTIGSTVFKSTVAENLAEGGSRCGQGCTRNH